MWYGEALTGNQTFSSAVTKPDTINKYFDLRVFRWHIAEALVFLLYDIYVMTINTFNQGTVPYQYARPSGYMVPLYLAPIALQALMTVSLAGCSLESSSGSSGQEVLAGSILLTLEVCKCSDGEESGRCKNCSY